MNKTVTIVGGIVIIVLIGSILYMNRSNIDTSNNATSNPITNTTGNINTGGGTTQAGIPRVVTNQKAIPTDTTVVLTGQVTPNGSPTSYWYEYGTTANMGNKTANQVLGSGFMAVYAPSYITGLTKDTTYYFRLDAINQYGQVSDGQYSFTTTHGYLPPVGTAPTTKTLSANNILRSTANINGEVTPNKADTQYWFEYGKTTDLGNTSALSSAGNGSVKKSVSISLSNLDPLTTYYFRLNAQNQFGTINGSILNFKTLGPTAANAPAVTTGNTTAVTSSKATLHGTVNPNLADTKYWFEYSTDPLLGSALLHSTEQTSVGTGSATKSVQADISGLNSKTTYYFRLVAQNNLDTIRGSRMTFKTK